MAAGTGRRSAGRGSGGVLPVPLLLGILGLLTLAVLAVLAARRQVPDPAEVDGRLPDYVERDLLTVNEWSRPGDPLKQVKGVVIHYVGNPATTARANRNYFESLSTGETGVSASSHFIVGLEGEVLACVPLGEIAYASNRRNADTVSIEVCHPDETGQFSPVTYARVVELTAWLCREFRLDPAEDVIRHYDVSGKECPLYYVEHEDAWEQLRGDVQAALEALEEAG